MNTLTAYPILRDLLVQTAPFTGEGFIKASVAAIARQFSPDFVFVARAPEIPGGCARMLAAWREGLEIKGWEFPLKGTPCELIYQEKLEGEWSGLRIGGSVAIGSKLYGRFEATRDTNFEAFIGVPLWSNERKIIGHVALFYRRELTDSHERSVMVELIELFSHKLQAELNRMVLEQEREIMVEQLRAANQRLELDTITDPLTQVHNRRYFDQRLTNAFARYRRRGESFGLLLLDLDHFKRINDAYGHDAGDEVLRRVATLFGTHTRTGTDVVFRIGGEEFAILCPGAVNTEALLGAGRRVNEAVAGHRFAVDGKEIPVTVSIGAALPSPEDGGFDGVYARADEALYAAKNQGRNRTVAGAHEVLPCQGTAFRAELGIH